MARSRFGQIERRVKGLHGEFHVFSLDQHTDLDLGCRDDLNIHPIGGKGREHALGNARMTAHSDTDHRDLCNIAVGDQSLEADLGLCGLDRRLCAVEIVGMDREGHIRAAIIRDILHDHIDIDIRGGQRPEDRGGDAKRRPP